MVTKADIQNIFVRFDTHPPMLPSQRETSNIALSEAQSKLKFPRELIVATGMSYAQTMAQWKAYFLDAPRYVQTITLGMTNSAARQMLQRFGVLETAGDTDYTKQLLQHVFCQVFKGLDRQEKVLMVARFCSLQPSTKAKKVLIKLQCFLWKVQGIISRILQKDLAAMSFFFLGFCGITYLLAYFIYVYIDYFDIIPPYGIMGLGFLSMGFLFAVMFFLFDCTDYFVDRVPQKLETEQAFFIQNHLSSAAENWCKAVLSN